MVSHQNLMTVYQIDGLIRVALPFHDLYRYFSLCRCFFKRFNVSRRYHFFGYPTRLVLYPYASGVPAFIVFCTEIITCTIALSDTFEKCPVETETFWNLQIPANSLSSGEIAQRITVKDLLNSIVMRFLVDCMKATPRSRRLLQCFAEPVGVNLATVRVPNFSLGLNQEILGFRLIPHTLAEVLDSGFFPVDLYSSSVFSCNTADPFTQMFMAQAPNVLMGLPSNLPHRHFILLFQAPPEIISLPFGQTIVDLPAFLIEPVLGSIETPALDDPIPSSPSHIVALVALNSFREYIMYSFGNDTTTAMYSREGGTRRKLWFGIQNHREVCTALKLAGFSDLSALGSTFRLPNGESLTLREILSSELGWDPATFKCKLGHYDWCSKFAVSHQWKFESLPAPGKFFDITYSIFLCHAS